MREPALQRTRERWATTKPEAVAAGSQAQIIHALRDGRADIETLCRVIEMMEQEAAELAEYWRIERNEITRERRQEATWAARWADDT